MFQINFLGLTAICITVKFSLVETCCEEAVTVSCQVETKMKYTVPEYQI